MSKKNVEFDMKRPPIIPKWYFRLLLIIVAFFFAGPFGTRTKIRRHNVKSMKEPALIISNHGSFVDFANMTYLTWPYVPCYVTAIDEFIGREWIMRQIGCFPKRKFTTDLTMIKRIRELINKKNTSVVLYPEARWSFAGIPEDITDSLGKMVKLCQCRVVILHQKGNFLRSPQWCKHPYRDVRTYCDAYEIVTKEESKTLPPEEIQRRIEEYFAYDEYKWQAENKIRIKNKKRAQNIHHILYKCTHCNAEGKTRSKGTKLWCEHCNTSWEMDEYGLMKQQNNGQSKFELVSDWYRWEREEVNKEVNEGNYYFEDDVRLERLYKGKFVPIGKARLIHDENGFNLKGTLDDGSPIEIIKPTNANRSCHVEFDYKGRGNCVDISTIEATYFAFPLNKYDAICKFNFSTEALFFKNRTK